MLEVVIPIKTTNPLNNSQGFSRKAVLWRARQKKKQRAAAKMMTTFALLSLGQKRLAEMMEIGVIVTLIRIAPSQGLDDDDNLRASQKWVKDGVTEAFGLKDDRDPRIRWRYDQERGPRGQYAVKIQIERRRPTKRAIKAAC
jgi:hypothetical protein